MFHSVCVFPFPTIPVLCSLVLPGKIPLTHLMTYYSPRWDLTQAVGQRACSRHNTREKSGAGEGGREGSYLLLSPSHTDTDIIIHYSASGQDRTGQVYQAAGHSCWWKMVRQQTLGQVETGEVELLLTRSQSRSVFHSSFSLGEIGGWWSSVAIAHMSGCVSSH